MYSKYHQYDDDDYHHNHNLVYSLALHGNEEEATIDQSIYQSLYHISIILSWNK